MHANGMVPTRDSHLWHPFGWDRRRQGDANVEDLWHGKDQDKEGDHEQESVPVGSPRRGWGPGIIRRG